MSSDDASTERAGEGPTPGSVEALPDVDLLTERRQRLLDRIEAAGGDPDEVEIVAVTKRFPVEAVEIALAAGFCSVGENYAQELVGKAQAFDARHAPGDSTPQWHMIGGLQRNKVKKLASLAPVYQTVDRPELLDEVAKRQPGATVFLQVNATSEAQKSGCAPDDVDALIARSRSLELDVAGLMTIGPTDGSDPSSAFEAVRRLVDAHGLRHASMGMSGDLEAAIVAGSTMIRVGSALFGPRPTTL